MEKHLIKTCVPIWKFNKSEIYLEKENIKAWQLQSAYSILIWCERSYIKINITTENGWIICTSLTIYVFDIKDAFWENFFDTDCNQQKLMILQNFK